ncbi:MAG: HTTM domain-containing protein [Candidatus Obscuribacterales bacterium]|nr:HTTM domain-containing protein [Candidatus Obscuribacterales bacterium]
MSLFKGIDSFFFRPLSPRPVGLFRILYCFVLLQLVFVHLASDLLPWYGVHAVVPADVAREHHHRLFPHINLLLLAPPTDVAVFVLFWLFVLAILCLLFGVASRLSALMVFLCLVTFQNQNPYNCNSGDVLIRLTAFWLMFTRCGEAYSLSRVFNGWLNGDLAALPHKNYSPWAQRLLQLQLAIVYTQATLSKGVAADWQAGNSVYYAGRYEEMKRFTIPFFFDTPILWKILTWSTLIVEGSLACLVWFPPLTNWVLLAGVGLHLGIDASMNIPMFQWIMLSYYLLFLPPADFDRGLEFIRATVVRLLRLEPVSLPFDGTSQKYERWVCVLKHFDLLHLIEPERIGGDEMEARVANTGKLDGLLVVQNGKVYRAFAAMIKLAQRIPLLWISLPVFVLPVLNDFARAGFDFAVRAARKANPPSKATHRAGLGRSQKLFCGGVLILLAGVSVTLSTKPVRREFTRQSLIAVREKFAREELKKTLPVEAVPAVESRAENARALSKDSDWERSFYHSTSELQAMLNRQSSKQDSAKIIAALKDLDEKEPQSDKEARWMAVSRLADVYWQDNRLDDAALLLNYVWDKRADRFRRTAKEDPELLATVLAIAAVRRDAGDFANAEKFLSMGVRYKQRTTGATSIESLVEKNNLALAQYLHGQSLKDSSQREAKWKESQQLFDQTILDLLRAHPQERTLLKRIEANRALLLRDRKPSDCRIVD